MNSRILGAVIFIVGFNNCIFLFLLLLKRVIWIITIKLRAAVSIIDIQKLMSHCSKLKAFNEFKYKISELINVSEALFYFTQFERHIDIVGLKYNLDLSIN